MKMKKVACVGELLIDFVCSDIDTNLFEGNNFLKKRVEHRLMLLVPSAVWAVKRSSLLKLATTLLDCF